MHAALLLPGPLDQVSGGYAYDRRMVAGLRGDGHQVDVVSLAGRFPLTDDLARESACACWDRQNPTARPVIDGLALPAFAGLEDALAARGAIGLIHHPTALETGFSDAERDALRNTERRLFAHLRRIIVTSETTAERLVAEFGVARERIAVVVPGTDDAPRAPGSGGPGCNILSVGTLVPRKGHDVLLRALSRLFDLDWTLTIVGSAVRDPVHARGLAAHAEELGIAQRVRLAGELDGEALEALWHSADIFALATWFEGYGMAIAEALKRGIPVAVTSGGAAAALMSPETGVVCEPGDHVQISKALRRMIFNPSIRAEISDAAWRVGQTLPDWSTQARAFAAAIGE